MPPRATLTTVTSSMTTKKPSSTAAVAARLLSRTIPASSFSLGHQSSATMVTPG